MVQMFNPPHPGEVLLDGVFSEAGISTADFAGRIGVPHGDFLRVLRGSAPMTRDLARRLAAELGGGADSWLLMQDDYEHWQQAHKAHGVTAGNGANQPEGLRTRTWRRSARPTWRT
jgi:addiction module HigA family antidote